MVEPKLEREPIVFEEVDNQEFGENVFRGSFRIPNRDGRTTRLSTAAIPPMPFAQLADYVSPEGFSACSMLDFFDRVVAPAYEAETQLVARLAQELPEGERQALDRELEAIRALKCYINHIPLLPIQHAQFLTLQRINPDNSGEVIHDVGRKNARVIPIEKFVFGDLTLEDYEKYTGSPENYPYLRDFVPRLDTFFRANTGRDFQGFRRLIHFLRTPSGRQEQEFLHLQLPFRSILDQEGEKLERVAGLELTFTPRGFMPLFCLEPEYNYCAYGIKIE